MPVQAAAPRLAAAALIVGLALLSANRAAAEPVAWPETGAPGDLVVASQPREIVFPAMSPGSRGYAAIDLRLDGKPWATTSFVVETTGALMEHPTGLTLSIRACEAPWTGVPGGSQPPSAAAPVCPSAARTVLAETPGSVFTGAGSQAGVVWPAGVIRQSTPGHLLLSLGLPEEGASDETLMGIEGDFTVRFTAQGDEDIVLPEDPDPVDPDPVEPPGATDPGAIVPDVGAASPGGLGGVIASTGVAVIGWALVGAGGIALGIVASVSAGRRGRRAS